MLDGNLEGEFKKLGIEFGGSKISYCDYDSLMKFLKNPKKDNWKKSGIYCAFVAAIKKAGGTVPPCKAHSD